ncbi:MAG: hypothetical protein ACREK8_08160 [Gemmatimonadales bacterium]
MWIRALALVMVLPVALAAQGTPMPMPMDHPGQITQHIRDQIAEARRVAAAFDTPEKARAAGYNPRFGDVPLQGEHFSNRQLVLTGTFDLEHPPILMFAPIGGEQKLVGVAYAYEVKEGEATPDGFDGAAMWHEHPALSLPGKRLVMTHVWFIESPNGPFAHDNLALPFLERGIGYPPDGWLDAATVRKLALTLSLARPRPPGSSRAIEGPRNDSIVAVLTQQRDSVNAMVTSLEAARVAGKRAEYRRVAAEIAGREDAIIATVKAIPTDSVARAFFDRLIDEALTDHDLMMAGGHPPPR